MYYVYVLEDTERKLYFGFTNNLRRRVSEHNRGSSKSTRNRKWSLVYYEAYGGYADAARREKQLKLHGRAKRQLKERIKDSRQKPD